MAGSPHYDSPESDDLWTRLIRKGFFDEAFNPQVTTSVETTRITMESLQREYNRIIMQRVPSMPMEEYARIRQELLAYANAPQHITEQMVEALRGPIKPFKEVAGVDPEDEEIKEEEERLELVERLKREQQAEGLL